MRAVVGHAKFIERVNQASPRIGQSSRGRVAAGVPGSPSPGQSNDPNALFHPPFSLARGCDRIRALHQENDAGAGPGGEVRTVSHDANPTLDFLLEIPVELSSSGRMGRLRISGWIGGGVVGGAVHFGEDRSKDGSHPGSIQAPPAHCGAILRGGAVQGMEAKVDPGQVEMAVDPVGVTHNSESNRDFRS